MEHGTKNSIVGNRVLRLQHRVSKTRRQNIVSFTWRSHGSLLGCFIEGGPSRSTALEGKLGSRTPFCSTGSCAMPKEICSAVHPVTGSAGKKKKCKRKVKSVATTKILKLIDRIAFLFPMFFASLVHTSLPSHFSLLMCYGSFCIVFGCSGPNKFYSIILNFRVAVRELNVA